MRRSIRYACGTAFALLAVGLAAMPQAPQAPRPEPQPRRGPHLVRQVITTGPDAILSIARSATRGAGKVKYVFSPRLVFPDIPAGGSGRVDAEGLIPIKVIAKVRNLGRDRPVYWRVQATRVSGEGRATVWQGSYEHLKFVIRKDTDLDRTFAEKVQMPPGYYYVLVSLCDDGVLPDWETGEPVAGRSIVSSGFYVTVP
jgi:hypothetical protein